MHKTPCPPRPDKQWGLLRSLTLVWLPEETLKPVGLPEVLQWVQGSSCHYRHHASVVFSVTAAFEAFLLLSTALPTLLQVNSLVHQVGLCWCPSFGLFSVYPWWVSYLGMLHHSAALRAPSHLLGLGLPRRPVLMTISKPSHRQTLHPLLRSFHS